MGSTRGSPRGQYVHRSDSAAKRRYQCRRHVYDLRCRPIYVARTDLLLTILPVERRPRRLGRAGVIRTDVS